MAERHIYLQIEQIEDYSPVEPQDKAPPPIQYRRDGMRNRGHEDGTIPEAERDARAMTALVYREYLDGDYLIPKTTKIVAADINEPVWSRRVPGTVLYAFPGETLKIHVLNADTAPHSFHIHGLEYGIDSDGAWPMGTQSSDGRRSDEICPGQSWTYTFRVTKDMIGAWPFHDHSSHASEGSVNRGLFGGLVVRERPFRKPIPVPLPPNFVELLRRDLNRLHGKRPVLRKALSPPAKTILSHHYEYLAEWLVREQAKLPLLPVRDRLHVPLLLHLMTSGQAKPLFDSGDLEENGVGVFAHLFEESGDYPYFCEYHPAMTATVEVVSGAPNAVNVNILDNPVMGFYPDSIQVAPGGTVTWINQSAHHHTVTSSQGASMPTHCINGRGFVGNSPTVIARSGQRIRWYLFNLDFGELFHNFHPHAVRWKLGSENIDVRALSPAESFVADTVAPPALILPDDVAAIQDAKKRPKNAKQYRLMGDFIFHCHVQHHMHNGMVGVLRVYQDVWLTPAQKQNLEDEVGIHLFDAGNPIPHVHHDRCKMAGAGMWEELAVAPEVTFMHACLLPGTEKVLYWGYTRPDQTRLFDAAGPTVSAPANQPADLPGLDADLSDLWSAEHAFLADAKGSLLAHGGFTGPGTSLAGNVRAFLFDPTTDSWAQTGDTTDSRFYSTTLTLADGKLITLFGSYSKTLEIYDPAAGTWSAPAAFPPAMHHHVFYPWTYLLPDGKLFIAGPHDPTHRFDWNPIGNIEAFSMISGNRSTGGEKGTSVLLPLRPPHYEPKVVVIGGDTPGAQKTAEIINLAAPVPAWQPLPGLNFTRAEQVNSVLLPDGYVLVAGGAGALPDGGPAELLDTKNTAAGWQMGATMKYRRGYHSAMILLADGSVLFGGDPNSGVFERYYPGYFHLARPTIAAAPSSTGYGATFDVDTPQAPAIAEVLLVRPGAVTHGFDMSQRTIECAIVGGGATTLQVQAPSHGNVAPPGWYLLFLVDGSRVPSIGHWIRLT